MTKSRSARLLGTETIGGEATGHDAWTDLHGRHEELWLGHDWLPRGTP